MSGAHLLPDAFTSNAKFSVVTRCPARDFAAEVSALVTDPEPLTSPTRNGTNVLFSIGHTSKGDNFFVEQKLAVCTELKTGGVCSASSFGKCLIDEMDKLNGDVYSIVPGVGKSCVGAAQNAISTCTAKCALGGLGK